MCVACKIARGGGRGVREGLGMAKNQWLLIDNFLSPNANNLFYNNDTKNIKRIFCQLFLQLEKKKLYKKKGKILNFDS